ncbi:MAG: hypothetical protein M1820_004730 [Bogoriella megaspora]|nr:MAG: hypothetical protein M1820_004730 [Bogoriella megaspora]
MESIAQHTISLALSPLFVTLVVFVAFLSYTSSIVIYRYFFHPLARFPGPRIAALTYAYEAYYDVVKTGQYSNCIMDMHCKYGPIVRINPDELHINDPSFIDTVYAGGSKKRDKFPYFALSLGTAGSVFGTITHEHHRLRRSAISPYFSRAAVSRLEPLIRSCASKLCDQFLSPANAGTGRPIELGAAYSALTTDVVTEYAFARSFNFLDDAHFQRTLRPALLAGFTASFLGRQLPWLPHFTEALPLWLQKKINPGGSTYLEFAASVRQQVKEIQDTMKDKRGEAGYEKRDGLSATIFHELMDSPILPEKEKELRRLAEEGQIIVGAGTETTAWTLAVVTFYLLDKPDIASKLREHLQRVLVGGEIPSWSALEQVSYLSATVQEGLRLMQGTVSRLQRIAREPLVFRNQCAWGNAVTEQKEWVIPAGTPVGMTSVQIHHNPDIFPDPLEFVPERWLDENGHRRKDLDQYMFSFSKGSRQCLGMQLAYAELHIMIAFLVMKVLDRMKLFETTVKDVRYHHETLVMRPYPESKGVQVLVQ